MPAANKNTGIQKCVIQRVKKRTGVVLLRSVGEKDSALAWKKSRTWSRAMMTITMPRSMSIDDRREPVATEGPIGVLNPSNILPENVE